jgi:hypothetical protein
MPLNFHINEEYDPHNELQYDGTALSASSVFLSIQFVGDPCGQYRIIIIEIYGCVTVGL